MADGLKLELDKQSFSAFAASLKATKEAARSAANVACWRGAQKVLARAKDLCPVDTGNLRASGVVRPDQPDRKDPRPGAEVAFTASYALIVHERTDVNHPVGEAKFLEKAMHEYAPRFAADARLILLEEIKRAARGKGR